MRESKDCNIQPLFVEAMIVGEKDSTPYAQLRMNYESLRMNPSGNQLEPHPFTSRAGESKGIHLHWTLPPSYTHGEQIEELKDITYPNLANRWLITRLALYHTIDKAQEYMVETSWIVESDVMNTTTKNALTASTVEVCDTTIPYRYIGTNRIYDGCTTSNVPHYKNFHALSTGIPYFCAYYPHCRNVLGFYDSLSDVAYTKTAMNDVTITYSICGWYEEAQEDEITVLLHGVLSDIKWYGNKHVYASGVPQMQNPHIAIGNTSNEALAALLASTHENPDIQEEILHSLLEGTLTKWSDMDGKSNVKRKLHQSSFTQEASHKKWYIEGNADGQFKQILQQINAYIEQLENIEEELHEQKEYVYLIWKELEEDNITKEQGEASIDEGRKNICKKEEQRNYIIEQKESLLAKLRLQIHSDCELKQDGGERYYRANEPVILLEGTREKSIYRMLESYSDDYPMHRKRYCFDHGVQIPLTDAIDGMLLIEEYEILYDVKQTSQVPLPNICSDVLKETMLMSEPCIAFLITKHLHNIRLCENEHHLQAMVHQFQMYVKTHYFVQEYTWNPMEYTVYAPPWNPLLMEWRVSFYPDRSCSNETYTCENWNFDGTHYHHKKDFSESSSSLYSGLSILSPHASLVLSEQFGKIASKEYENLKIKFDNMFTLSQVMGGLYDHMVMRARETLVLPWRDIQSNSLNRFVSSLVQEEHVYARARVQEGKHTFYPVRAGRLKLESLRIIDTFGRTLTYPVNTITIAKSLRDEDDSTSSQLVFPPRILQPTRLSFHWKPVEDHSCIFGWLWANINESCLHIYTPQGRMLGSIQLQYRSTKKRKLQVVFQNPPGETRSLNEIMKDTNTFMAQFINNVMNACQKDAQVLQSLLQVISEAMWDIHTSGMQRNLDIFAYLGHPIACCNASLAFECKGPWKKNGLYDKNKSTLEDATFSLRIGDEHNQHDGTIAFFVQQQKGEDTKLHICRKTSKSNSYIDSNSIISIGLNKQPTLLSILMSPYGHVSFVSDIVPVKEGVLHASLVEEALTNIYLTLFYGPFLTSEDSIQLYLPKEMEKEWEYLEYEDVEQKKIHRNILEPQLLLSEDKNYMIKEGWLLLHEQKRKKKEETYE